MSVGLKAKKEKCKFFQKSVKYLGHELDESGIHPTEDKVKAIKNTPSLTNIKQLQ